MNEAIERKEENGMNEAAENKETTGLEQAVMDDRENAPREEAKVEDKEEKKKGKKKRKKHGMSITACALLMVIALVFGAVVGYGYGRGVGAVRLADAQEQVILLTQALEEAQSLPVYDSFNEGMTEENLSALNELAGTQAEGDDVASVLVGGDSLDAAAAQDEQDNVVVAQYSGGQILRDEAAREYEEQVTNLIFAGYSEDEIADTLLDEVLRDLVIGRVLEEHAKEMGLYELTQDDLSRIEAQALASYNEQLDICRAFVNTDGLSQEEANGAVKAYLQQSEGVTLESIKQEMEAHWWSEKVFDEITKDVSVDDAALQTAYNAKLAEQKESFTAYADDYEFAQMNGETIVYNLPGYRSVRMLMVGLNDAQAVESISLLSEEIANLNPETDAEALAGLQAQMDALYAPAEAKASQALSRIRAGEAFEDVLNEFGEDMGMKDETLRKTGYYVSADSLLWSEEVISAAMALEKPGDVSGVVRLSDGVCILEYAGDVAEGGVALESVREALEEEAIENAKYAAYEAKVNQWLEEADAVYYPERMQ